MLAVLECEQPHEDEEVEVEVEVERDGARRVGVGVGVREVSRRLEDGKTAAAGLLDAASELLKS